MTAVNASRYRHSSALLCSASALSLLMVCQITVIHAAPQGPKPDANASREAFLQVYKVFTSPRCQNCHPPGDSPLQGDDSHAHLQYVRRGPEGRGVRTMACATCHGKANPPASFGAPSGTIRRPGLRTPLRRSAPGPRSSVGGESLPRGRPEGAVRPIRLRRPVVATGGRRRLGSDRLPTHRRGTAPARTVPVPGAGNPRGAEGHRRRRRVRVDSPMAPYANDRARAAPRSGAGMHRVHQMIAPRTGDRPLPLVASRAHDDRSRI